MSTDSVMDFINHQGVALAILAVIAWFIVSKVWPFYTGPFFTAQLARQKVEDDRGLALATAITKLVERVESIGTNTDRFSASLQTHVGGAIQTFTNAVLNQTKILEEIRDSGARSERSMDSLTTLLTGLQTVVLAVKAEIEDIQRSIQLTATKTDLEQVRQDNAAIDAKINELRAKFDAFPSLLEGLLKRTIMTSALNSEKEPKP